MKSRLVLRLAALLVAGALAGPGCSKKEATTAAAPAAAPAAEGEAATEQPAEETTETAASEESTTDALEMQHFDVQETLAATDKAAQTKDWSSAADNLMKLQMSGSIKTDAESWQYNRRMTVLQSQLLEAADSGDPKAAAAIERLRRSRRVR